MGGLITIIQECRNLDNVKNYYLTSQLYKDNQKKKNQKESKKNFTSIPYMIVHNEWRKNCPNPLLSPNTVKGFLVKFLLILNEHAYPEVYPIDKFDEVANELCNSLDKFPSSLLNELIYPDQEESQSSKAQRKGILHSARSTSSSTKSSSSSNLENPPITRIHNVLLGVT